MPRKKTTKMDKIKKEESVRLPTIESVNRFVFAGKAYFSAVRDDFSLHFRIIRKRHPRSVDLNKVFYMSYAKRNWRDKKWYYMGYISIKEGKESWVFNGDYRLKVAFDWLEWILRRDLDPRAEFYHHNLCGRCGRNLLDLGSVKRGFGPICWKKINYRGGE